jgi:hypothetical protein
MPSILCDALRRYDDEAAIIGQILSRDTQRAIATRARARMFSVDANEKIRSVWMSHGRGKNV